MSEAIKNQNELLKDIIQSSWNGIGIVDENGIFRFVNKAFSPILGFSEKDIIKKSFIDFMLPKYKKSFLNLLEENKKNIYNNKIIIGCLRGDNKIVYLEVVINQMSNKKLFVINTVDITTEFTHKQLINRFVIQCKLDKKLKFIEISEAFSKIIGYPPAEIIGKHYEVILSNHNDPQIMFEYIDALSVGKNFKGKIILINKDGVDIYVEFVSNVTKNKYGDVLGFNIVMIDITGQVLLEKSKQNLQQQVLDNQEKLKIMSDTMRTVAHEWRQPLNAISLDAQNLMFELDFEDEVDKDKIKTSLDEVYKQTKTLSDVIAIFQDVVEPKGSKRKRKISEIILEALHLSELYESKYIKEDIEDIQSFKTYPKELAKAIANILINAKEAVTNNNGSYIKIKAYKKNNDIYIDISNDGGVIDDKNLDKIFLPYFSTKEERNGVGLGLYITKTIIELHLKGKLSVKNIDNGVEFNIILPMKALE